MEEKIFTRRDFIRAAAGAAVATALGCGILDEAQAQPAAKVVLIRNARVLSQPDKMQEILQSMLDEAVKALLGTSEPLEAWGKLIKSSDVVGVKTNVWAKLPTPKALEGAIKRRVLDVGVPEKNMDIDDRGVLKNPIFHKATGLINVRPLRTHRWAGIGTCLKNYIQFDPDRPSFHEDACAALGKIWSYPIVQGKTRLNILSALTPQFYGRGTNVDPRYVWPYGGLIVGTDPVAVDTIGAHLVQVKRIAFFGEDQPMDSLPSHIVVADKKYHLGISDLNRIQLIKLDYSQNEIDIHTQQRGSWIRKDYRGDQVEFDL